MSSNLRTIYLSFPKEIIDKEYDVVIAVDNISISNLNDYLKAAARMDPDIIYISNQLAVYPENLLVIDNLVNCEIPVIVPIPELSIDKIPGRYILSWDIYDSNHKLISSEVLIDTNDKRVCDVEKVKTIERIEEINKKSQAIIESKGLEEER